MERKYLFNIDKIKYVTGDKPEVDCILCEICNDNPDVKSLKIFSTEHMILTVNLYPFNAGHLMIFPKRHVVDYCDLNDHEILDMGSLTRKAVGILKEEFNPAGFNIGFNMGKGSGASISHIHQHIVPRFTDEVGFLDVLAGTRVMVIDPEEVLKKIKKHF